MNQRQLILKKAECLNDCFVRQTRIDVDDNTSGPFDDVQDANNMHRINKIRLNDMEVKDVLRLIFKRLFSFLQENNVLTSFQSGFIPGDSSVNELTLLYNVFCKALDDELDVRSVFFDISEAFDRLRHKGLLHKLKSTGVSGKLFI